MSRSLSAAACVIGALAVVSAQGDPASGQTTFRATSTLVPVDVRVLDKQGNPVTGLTQADFTVFENGVRQDLRQFFRQVLTADPAAASAPLRPSLGGTALAPQNYRVFLLVLGRGNLIGPADAVAGLVHLVQDRLLPQDRVAVMAWNRATDFTTDHARIAGVLERFQQADLGMEVFLQRFWLGGPLPAEIQRRIDDVFGGAGAPGVRSIHRGLLDSGLIDVDLRRTERDLETPEEAPDRPIGVSDDADQPPADFSLLLLGLENLRRLDGEKHLVYVNQYGLLLPRAEDDRNLARMANDARVALDVIRAGGTQFAMSPGQSPSLALQPAATSRTLAELTGGRFDANHNPTAAVDLDRIDASSRVEYLLGYAPSDPAPDGRYRDITIKVNRPGVTVLYRHGYFAQAPLMLDRKAAMTHGRMADAAMNPGELHGLPIRARASTPAPGTVGLTVTVDLSRVALEKSGALNIGAIEFAAFCLDAAQRPVGDAWKTLNLAFSDERRAEVLRTGVSATMTMTVAVTERARSVKVVAYDYAADVVGSVIVNVP